jgi:hypothetical protein
MEYLQSLPPDLASYESQLLEIVNRGLGLYVERYGSLRGTQSLRSQASNINDCLVEEATSALPQFIFRRLNLFLLRIGNYQIKLKKLDENLCTRNHPTQMVFDFLRQLRLFNSEPMINLHLGYQVNGIDLRNSAIYLTKPNGRKRIEWAYQFQSVAAIAVPSQNEEVVQISERVTPRAEPIATEAE